MRDLLRQLLKGEAPIQWCYIKSCYERFLKIQWKISALKSLLNKLAVLHLAVLLKKRLQH